MKKIFAILLLVAIGLTMVEAGGYKKSATVVTNKPNGWSILTYSHTFVAATDTAYFIFTPNRPGMYFQDTLIAEVTAKVTPLSDTSNVAWEVWTTSDTTNWWVSANDALNPLIWNKTAVARDSTASGVNFRNILITSGVYKGWYPYVALVGIGKAALANGKANEIGNIMKIDIIKP